MPERNKDEINEFNLPQIPEEEIQKFTLPEDLSEVERVKELLGKKTNTQQGYVFVNACNVFRDNPDSQAQILPIILKNMTKYNEELQVDGGKALAQLLRADILEAEYYKELRTVCSVILRQWSKAVLAEWIDVYTLLLPRMVVQDSSSQEKLEKECIDIAIKMGDFSQPISVRISSALFLAKMASNNSLSSAENYVAKVLPKFRQSCQDFNWEVRKEICLKLFTISKYIAPAAKEEAPLFSDINELLEDEEHEVKFNAIKQYVKHLWHLFPNATNTTQETVAIVKKLFQTAADNSCPKDIKNQVLKSVNKILLKTASLSEDIAEEIYPSLLELLRSSLGTDMGKQMLAKSISGTTVVYAPKSRFYSLFYLPLYQQFLKENVLPAGTIPVSQIIARTIHMIIVNAFYQSEICMQEGVDVENLKAEVLQMYLSLLKSENKVILSEIVRSASLVFQFFSENQHELTQPLVKIFNDKVKKLIYQNTEKVLQNNWRFHLEYFCMIEEITKFSLPSEMMGELLPVMVNTLKGPGTSLPVKKKICETLAQQLCEVPDFALRSQIQHLFTKDISRNHSYQIRMASLLFLEQILSKISRRNFKQNFLDAYFLFKEELTVQLLMHYVRLAPEVRQKLDDNKSIEKLEVSLNSILHRVSQKAGSSELIQQCEQTLLQLKSEEFLEKVEIYQVSVDMELLAKEEQLLAVEKEASQSHKKRELEFTAKAAREEYMKKMGSISASSSKLGMIRDNKTRPVSNNKSQSSVGLKGVKKEQGKEESKKQKAPVPKQIVKSSSSKK